jgi:hypothetical protein
MFPILDLSCEEHRAVVVEVPTGRSLKLKLLKLQQNGQFHDEFVKIKDTQIHYVVFSDQSTSFG